MPNTFALVKKGYDPAAVDVFVREQAEAWRAELAKAASGLEEWRRRAEEFGAAVASLEQRVAATERTHAEELSVLESALSESRWARDQATASLLEERAAHARAGAEADGIIGAAQREAARRLAAAEMEIQQMYAQARKRIAMAEAHAKERLERLEVSVGG
jgi:cell division septum initiation protein DivIVA